MESRPWWRRRWRWSSSGKGFPALGFRLSAFALRYLSIWKPYDFDAHLTALRLRSEWQQTLLKERRGRRKPDSHLLLAKGVQDGDAADGEATHGSQRGDQQDGGAEVKDISEDSGDGEDEAEYVEPERGADRIALVLAETELQQ